MCVKKPPWIEFFTFFILVFVTLPIYTVQNDTLLEKTSCKCQSYSTCLWSKTLFDKLSVLSKNHTDRSTLLKKFQAQVCNKNKHYVWCCEDGKPKSELDLIIETLNSTLQSSNEKSNLRSKNVSSNLLTYTAGLMQEHVGSCQWAHWGSFRLMRAHAGTCRLMLDHARLMPGSCQILTVHASSCQFIAAHGSSCQLITGHASSWQLSP